MSADYMSQWTGLIRTRAGAGRGQALELIYRSEGSIGRYVKVVKTEQELRKMKTRSLIS